LNLFDNILNAMTTHVRSYIQVEMDQSVYYWRKWERTTSYRTELPSLVLWSTVKWEM